MTGGAPVPEGWVEIVSLARLWRAVPERERVTEQDVLRKFDDPSNEYRLQQRDRWLERLSNPSCEITHKQGLDFPGKWAPCPNPVAEGESRCAKHGGSGLRAPVRAKRKTKRDLQAEVKRLERELAEFALRVATQQIAPGPGR